MRVFNPFLVIPLVLFFFVFSCGQQPKKEVLTEFVKPVDGLVKNHLIPANQGKEMFREFEKNRIEVLDTILKERYEDDDFEDTKFIWYSLDELKAYLEYIEQIQIANPKQDVSGLRIYFGAYPNSSKFTEGKSIKHPKQQTIFMVPTVALGKGGFKYETMNHLPFIIQSDSDNELSGSFEIVDELMLDYNKKKRLEMFRQNSQNIEKAGVSFNISLSPRRVAETSTMYNEGEMAPPPNKGEND
jgi:hypothetical protein